MIQGKLDAAERERETPAPASSAKVKRRLMRTSTGGGGHAARWLHTEEEITSSHRGWKRKLVFLCWQGEGVIVLHPP